jgi:hypothetical protein
VTLCAAKHAVPQIPDSEWLCPKCGVSPEGGFVIDESDETSDDDCPLLHGMDSIICSCGFGTSGKKLAQDYAKKKGLVRCEHCKGAGMVKA